MKIAHFINVAPHCSGMYETAREICEAELEGGHDAALINTSWYPKGAPNITSSRDRGVDVYPISWSLDADIHALHSIVPDQAIGYAPVVVFLHGAPEYTFYDEVFNSYKGDKSFSTLLLWSQDSRYKKFVTLWDRHYEIWKTFFGDSVEYVPSCVNKHLFVKDGKKMTLQHPGKINIGFCDSWRETYWKDPFRIFSGVRLFSEKHSGTKLHLFATPSDSIRAEVWNNVMLAIKRHHPDLIGDIWTRITGPDAMYRSLDMIVSTVCEESRIYREALSCNIPVVSNIGLHANKYTADFNSPVSICSALEGCWSDIGSGTVSLQSNNEFSYNAMLKKLESIYTSLI